MMSSKTPDDNLDYPVDRHGFQTPVARKHHSGFIAILGTIASYAAMLGAHGNGWSPLIFLLLGFFGAPLLARVLLWRMGWRRRNVKGLAAIALVAGISFGLAKWSVRIEAADATREIFNQVPLAGFTSIAARQQWYDGVEMAVSFQSSRRALDALLGASEFEDQSPPSNDQIGYATTIPFLYTADLVPPNCTHYWKSLKQSANGSWKSIDIIWNESTGAGFLRAGWH
jgi:hypothetical protein